MPLIVVNEVEIEKSQGAFAYVRIGVPVTNENIVHSHHSEVEGLFKESNNWVKIEKDNPTKFEPLFGDKQLKILQLISTPRNDTKHPHGMSIHEIRDQVSFRSTKLAIEVIKNIRHNLELIGITIGVLETQDRDIYYLATKELETLPNASNQ